MSRITIVGRTRVAAACILLTAVGAHAQDFNGDGFDDLVVGAPGEDIGGVVDAGAVHVIFGAGPGLGLDAAAALPSLVITQSGFAIELDEPGDMFGSVLAWGDFNADGFDDLAIGVPGEDLGAIVDAGLVNVLYGTPGGFVPMGPPVLTQMAMPFPSDGDEPGDMFGGGLAAGDFNGDGIDDLAIGSPGEELPGLAADSGMIQIAHGAPFIGLPLGPIPALGLMEQAMIFPDPSEAGDMFGGSMVSADFDGDGTDDLVVGIPLEDMGAAVDAGRVLAIYGFFGAGLMPAGSESWSQNSPGIIDASQAGDNFGRGVAAGDFNGDGFTDLAIGAPGEAGPAGGVVHVIYSGGPLPVGLDAFAPVPAEFWHQNIPGVPSTNLAGDLFGSALAAGDFDGNGIDDLAIGVPSENAGGVADTGATIVVYGLAVALGLDAFGPVPAEYWHQNAGGVPEANGAFDMFGSSLAAADYDGNGMADLAIGVPLENTGGAAVVDAGCVNVIYGAGAALGLDGFGPVGGELWHQNIPGIPDVIEVGDGFGNLR